jgi:uncharacterized membrane protein
MLFVRESDMVKVEHHNDDTRVYLIPNRSATWRQNQCATGILGAMTLAVATFWSLQGFWLILPFAGLEVALLWFLSYKVCSAAYHQQVVLFTQNGIEVQWGQRFLKKRWRFDRRTAELEVVRPHHSESPQRLLLKDGDQTLAVADKLNKADVKQALDAFRSLGFSPTFSGKTAIIAKEALIT